MTTSTSRGPTAPVTVCARHGHRQWDRRLRHGARRATPIQPPTSSCRPGRATGGLGQRDRDAHFPGSTVRWNALGGDDAVTETVSAFPALPRLSVRTEAPGTTGGPARDRGGRRDRIARNGTTAVGTFAPGTATSPRDAANVEQLEVLGLGPGMVRGVGGSNKPGDAHQPLRSKQWGPR